MRCAKSDQEMFPKALILQEEEFSITHWFRHGWTLQEPLAPKKLYFHASDWSPLGSKRNLMERLGANTTIPPPVLHTGQVKGYIVGQRISWASGQPSGRVEDDLCDRKGLFSVNMPLI